MPAPSAQAYRYSPANLAAIVPLPDQPVSSTFNADFPANSITLFVLSPASGGSSGGSASSVYLPLIQHP
jgi:Asp-tRNA(Asn)/Glu-tRNA(Gln) amidotransferase A subunit family amidase